MSVHGKGGRSTPMPLPADVGEAIAAYLRNGRPHCSVIALWLGHESVETTQIYLDADLSLKEQVLAKIKPIKGKAGHYRPDDELLAFLKGL